MTMYQIPYGRGLLQFQVDSELLVDWIAPPQSQVEEGEEIRVKIALEHPLSGDVEAISRARKVGIAINDKTRPVPHQLLLPPLLEYLEKMGISPDNITLFVATGTHQPMGESEMQKLLPEAVWRKVRVVSHDVHDDENIQQIGVTQYGSRVGINKRYYQSDLRIVVGDIELHHFAGFSGGVKSAVIGLGSTGFIYPNHSMLTDARACIGAYEDNPLRQDIEEAGDMIGVHFALNAVLDEHKRIVDAWWGKPRNVMWQGIQVVKRLSEVVCSGAYDIVIASAGGFPKDINFYQAQKAISHARLFAKKGGAIILVAECCEGAGSEGFEHFMEGVTSIEKVYRKFSEMGFVVGPHKAVQVARQLEENRIYLVSSVEHDRVERWLLKSAPTIEAAIVQASCEIGNKPRMAILPYATGVIPAVLG